MFSKHINFGVSHLCSLNITPTIGEGIFASLNTICEPEAEAMGLWRNMNVAR